jgi:hypothetical protein
MRKDDAHAPYLHAEDRAPADPFQAAKDASFEARSARDSAAAGGAAGGGRAASS